MRFVVGGRRLAEHAGHEARDRIDDHERAELAAGQHVVADRQLLVDRDLEHALVDALVAPAHEHEVRQRGERSHARLGQRRPRGDEQDAMRGRRARGLVDRREQRLGLHHHARPAAVRSVVDGAVAIGREVARVDGVDGDHAGLARAADDAGGQRRLDQLGEDRDDRELHRRIRSSGRPSGGSTVTTPPATSTFFTN